MLRRLEACLKHLSGITPGIYAHNPVQLLAPDADDILIGGWHWTSVGSLRTFPVAEYWYNHYEMNSWERLRSLTVHQRACQKLMYNRGSPRHQLLLRSHYVHVLKTCALFILKFVSIVRDPVDALESFAGLSTSVIRSSMNVDLLNSLAEENDDSLLRWPDLFVKVLSNMMGREADLHEMSSQKSEICCHITFERFKDDPVASLQEIYSRIALSFYTENETSSMNV